MFEKTRLKLTLWYLLIIMLISLFFSCFIYIEATREFDRILRVERFRIEHPNLIPTIINNTPLRPYSNGAPEPELIGEANIRVLTALFGVNLIILIISTLAGYFLAGRTLKPIKEMVDEQNRFVTDASHELNTPLTSLKTSIEVNLRDKSFNLIKAKDVLKSNLEDVDRLQILSSDLIKLTQYQKTNGSFSLGSVNLKDVVNQAFEKVKTLANKKKIKVNVSVEKICVSGDFKSLTEVFTILLDNAIKYSKEKGIVIVSSKEKDSKVEVSVKDQGIGISKDDLPFIFDRFYRADRSRSKQKTGGYGLGLSIAKRIAEVHNGNIIAESKGKGSTFIVTLLKSKS